MGSTRSKKKLTTKQLRDFAAEMHKQASKVEATLAVAEQMGIDWLNVSHYPTGIDGIESITKFTAAIFNAIDEKSLRNALDGTLAISESQGEALKLTDARRKQRKD